MRTFDTCALAWDNLNKRKIRTLLTTAGVMIGVGALICMFAFGQGVQRNITEQFEALELFNYVVVTVKETPKRTDPNGPAPPVLNEALLDTFTALPDVEAAYPEMRFPAQVRIHDEQDFTLVQVLPARALTSGVLPLRHGRGYDPNEPNGLIIGHQMLRSMGLRDGEELLEEPVEIRTLMLDLNPWKLLRSILSPQGMGLPIGHRSYRFFLAGISHRRGMGGPLPMRSDVVISAEAAAGMKKLAVNSLFDFFNPATDPNAYGSVTVKVTSPTRIETVKQRLQARGFNTFALIDRMEEMKKAFIMMDMFLLAVGMIGTTVACLGITNTMVMTVMERTRDIGVMKAVGASDRDVYTIFLCESGLIGFIGGLMGLGLAFVVSLLINTVINAMSQRHGVPSIQYFTFPLWLCICGIILAIVVSLIAGFIPTHRAAAINPVSALRHD